MKTMPLCFALACLAGPTVASDGAAKPDVVAFNATVRVEVDAAGMPVKVQAPNKFPEKAPWLCAARKTV